MTGPTSWGGPLESAKNSAPFEFGSPGPTRTGSGSDSGCEDRLVEHEDDPSDLLPGRAAQPQLVRNPALVVRRHVRKWTNVLLEHHGEGRTPPGSGQRHRMTGSDRAT